MAQPIPASEARNMLTSFMLPMLKEDIKVPSFFRSLFEQVESNSMYIVNDIQFLHEKVATDVARGSDGNFNKFSVATEEKFEPPYYREVMALSELEVYQRLVGDSQIGPSDMARCIEEMARKMNGLISKIDRAHELQAAQAVDTGIVVCADGSNIDFQRDAGQLVDKGAGQYWVEDTVDPDVDLLTQCELLRSAGNSNDPVVNIIFGGLAWEAYKNNKKIREKASIEQWKLSDITTPLRDARGGNLVGKITIGSFTAMCWTTGGVYKNSAGVVTKYMNDKKVIVTPSKPDFAQVYTAVPCVLGGKSFLSKGKYHLNEDINSFNGTHKSDVKSAGLAVLKNKRQVGTLKVLA